MESLEAFRLRYYEETGHALTVGDAARLMVAKLLADLTEPTLAFLRKEDTTARQG